VASKKVKGGGLGGLVVALVTTVVTVTSHHGGSKHVANAIDAYSRPPVSAMQAAGVELVSVYVGCGSIDKQATKAEITAEHNGGLAISPNCEGYADGALGGAAQGRVDSSKAVAAVKALGFPKGTVIYYSVDFDAQPGQYATILAYLKAANTADYPAYAYGHAALCDWLHAHGNGISPYCWQTYAWSSGKISKWAVLYQFSNGHNIAGHAVDYDEIRDAAHVGAWLGVKKVPAPPQPVVKPAAKPKVKANNPTVTGTRKVGHVLKARPRPSKWTPGSTSTYQWMRDGHVIKGATHRTYKLTNADAGKRIRVRVTGRHSGFTSVNRWSAIPRPTPSAHKTVPVRPGDSLAAIAARNHLTLKRLIELNPAIKPPALIYPGERVRVA
jgi:hypothetical protein